MSTLSSIRRHVHFHVILLGLVFSGLTTGVVPQASGSDTRIIRVEEEWELSVGTPNVASNSPQVVCAMTPFDSLNRLYMTFEINHRSDPEYVAGGLNMLVWQGEQHLVTKSTANSLELNTAGETVCWTQAMEVRDGLLTFEIVQGRSATWGEFGGLQSLKASVATSLTDLSNYNPGVSVKHSGVNFASGCVNNLTLKSIRYYRADGTVQVDASPRVVVEEMQTQE